MTLQAYRLPPNQFGFFICSRDTNFAPGLGPAPAGLCLSGDIGRFNGQVMNAGEAGEFFIDVDSGTLPLSSMPAALPGDTIYFQCWHREVPSGAGFSTGLVIPFS